MAHALQCHQSTQVVVFQIPRQRSTTFELNVIANVAPRLNDITSINDMRSFLSVLSATSNECLSASFTDDILRQKYDTLYEVASRLLQRTRKC